MKKKGLISRLSFADESFMEQFLDIHPGSVSVLGLMNDKEHRVKLAIDEDVLKEEMFGCHPCENTSSIRFKTRDLMEKILPALNITPAIVHLVGTE
jgi:Ala-tRNA(Pro) deacylase